MLPRLPRPLVILLLLLPSLSATAAAQPLDLAGRSTENYDRTDSALHLLQVLSTRTAALSEPARIAGHTVRSHGVDATVRFHHELRPVEIAALEQVGVAFRRLQGQILHVGSVYLVQIPWTRLSLLEALPDVRRIEATTTLFDEPQLDVVASEVGAEALWTLARVGGGGQVTGRGVRAGILDTGVDWQHPALSFPNGTGKVLRILSTRGVYVRGGNLTAAPVDDHGHGTAVTGIVAGGTPGVDRYVGVAPGAGILMGIVFGPAGVELEQGIAWMARERPQVLSMSLGRSVFSSLDGSTNREVMLDTMARQGTVIVASAGNAGGGTRHANTAVPGATGGRPGRLELRMNIPNQDPLSPAVTVKTEAVFATILWRNPSVNLGFQIELPGVAPVRLSGRDNETVVGNFAYFSWRSTSARGTAQFDIAVRHVQNLTVPEGVWTITVENPTPSPQPMHAYMLDIVENPWPLPTTGRGGFMDFLSGQNTIGDPSTADSAISVAAYVHRSGAQQGMLASFSSVGPRIDGGRKPEIAAPGVDVITARSKDERQPAFARRVVGAHHQFFSGTSASAPIVAGAAALLWETQPEATAAQIREQLLSGARVDTFVRPLGEPWNPFFGAGKLDALSAFGKVVPIVRLRALDLPANRTLTILAPGNLAVTLPSEKLRALAFTGESVQLRAPEIIGPENGHRWVLGGHQIDGGALQPAPTVSAVRNALVEWRWLEQWRVQVRSSFGVAQVEGTSRGTTSRGEEWYDAGTIVRIQLAATTVESAPGSRARFQGWQGTVQTANTTITIRRLTQPHRLTAQWLSEHLVQVETPYGQATGAGWYADGSEAEVTAPATVGLGEGTRATFRSWNLGTPANEPRTRVRVTGPVTLRANYVTEHWVEVRSAYGNPSGGGWYPSGATAELSVPREVSLGEGSRAIFVGWSQGTPADQPRTQLQVTQPSVVTVAWRREHQVSFAVTDASGQVPLRATEIRVRGAPGEEVGLPQTGGWLAEGNYDVVQVRWNTWTLAVRGVGGSVTKATVFQIRLRVQALTVAITDVLGLPVEGATIRVALANGTEVQGLTDRQGLASLGLLPVAEYTLQVSYLGQTQDVRYALTGDTAAQVRVVGSGGLAVVGVAAAVVAGGAVMILRRRRRAAGG